MLRAACLLILLLLLLQLPAHAQPAPLTGTRQPRILLLVDASSSMLQPWGGSSTRFKTAGAIISSLMDSIYAVNAGVEFGLRVYGHQSPAQNNDCTDTKQEVMFSKNNYTQMGLRMASLRPFGVSPIAYSLQEAAANDLVDDARNAYSIILITDGGESCGGDICDVVKRLIARKIYFHPYIISLVDYAPLKQQYTCLGTYLQAAKPDEIPTVIRTIVDDYRPLLSAPIMAVKTEIKTTITPPVVITLPVWTPEHTTLPYLSIKIPQPARAETTAVRLAQPKVMSLPPLSPISKPQPEPVTIASLSNAQQRPFQIKTYRPLLYSMALPRIASVSKPPPEPVVEAPKPPKPEIIAPLTSAPRRRLPVNAHVPTTLPGLSVLIDARVAPPPREAPVVVAPPVKRDTIIAVKPAPPRRDTATKTTVVIRKIDPPAKPVVKPATTKPVITSTKPKETEFTKQTEDSKETTLSILFTDGRGKFYASSPQLQLLDAVTGKLVKQFYRTVDPSGNPDPQVVPAGNYNLLIAGRANMLMRRVPVEVNKNNKVIVRVSNGSLVFRYDDAPDRPVSEFEALVNIRFEPGPTVRQRCTAELEFAPGNYYIEVNTMPISRFNADIDFGAATVIYLPQPGFVQFTNSTPKGIVTLFAPLGNKFVPFHTMNVTGNPSAQRLQLKPGAYEAHWVKNPSLPYAAETVERFNVQSNSVTEVELH